MGTHRGDLVPQGHLTRRLPIAKGAPDPEQHNQRKGETDRCVGGQGESVHVPPLAERHEPVAFDDGS